MVAELQISTRASTKIEIVGELDERSMRLACERVDAELTVCTPSVLVSLRHVTGTHWAALCGLTARIRTLRARGFDVRLGLARPSLRGLLATVALAELWPIEEEPPVGRTVIVA